MTCSLQLLVSLLATSVSATDKNSSSSPPIDLRLLSEEELLQYPQSSIGVYKVSNSDRYGVHVLVTSRTTTYFGTYKTFLQASVASAAARLRLGLSLERGDGRNSRGSKKPGSVEQTSLLQQTSVDLLPRWDVSVGDNNSSTSQKTGGGGEEEEEDKGNDGSTFSSSSPPDDVLPTSQDIRLSHSSGNEDTSTAQPPSVIKNTSSKAVRSNDQQQLKYSSVDWKSLSDAELLEYPRSSYGVYKKNSGNRYQVIVPVHGKQTYFGTYSTSLQATAACAAARLRLGLSLDRISNPGTPSSLAAKTSNIVNWNDTVDTLLSRDAVSMNQKGSVEVEEEEEEEFDKEWSSSSPAAAGIPAAAALSAPPTSPPREDDIICSSDHQDASTSVIKNHTGSEAVSRVRSNDHDQQLKYSSVDWTSLSEAELQEYPRSSYGVYKKKSGNRYQVIVPVHGKQTYLGSYSTSLQATAACAAARLQLGLSLDRSTSNIVNRNDTVDTLMLSQDAVSMNQTGSVEVEEEEEEEETDYQRSSSSPAAAGISSAAALSARPSTSPPREDDINCSSDHQDASSSVIKNHTGSEAVPRVRSNDQQQLKYSSVDWKSLSEAELLEYPRSSYGVYKKKSGNRYQVIVPVHGKQTYLGSYSTSLQATAACAAARLQLGLCLDRTNKSEPEPESSATLQKSSSSVDTSMPLDLGDEAVTTQDGAEEEEKEELSANLSSASPHRECDQHSSLVEHHDEDEGKEQQLSPWTAESGHHNGDEDNERMRQSSLVDRHDEDEGKEQQQSPLTAAESDHHNGDEDNARMKQSSLDEHHDGDEDGEQQSTSVEHHNEDSNTSNQDEQMKQQSQLATESERRDEASVSACDSACLRSSPVDWRSLSEEDLQRYPQCSLGVHKSKAASTDRYRVCFKVNGTRKYFGTYNTVLQASVACADARLQHGLSLNRTKRSNQKSLRPSNHQNSDSVGIMPQEDVVSEHGMKQKGQEGDRGGEAGKDEGSSPSPVAAPPTTLSSAPPPSSLSVAEDVDHSSHHDTGTVEIQPLPAVQLPVAVGDEANSTGLSSSSVDWKSLSDDQLQGYPQSSIGVLKIPSSGRYQIRFTVDGKLKNFGCFGTFLQASVACAAARLRHGLPLERVKSERQRLLPSKSAPHQENSGDAADADAATIRACAAARLRLGLPLDHHNQGTSKSLIVSSKSNTQKSSVDILHQDPGSSVAVAVAPFRDDSSYHEDPTAALQSSPPTEQRKARRAQRGKAHLRFSSIDWSALSEEELSGHPHCSLGVHMIPSGRYQVSFSICGKVTNFGTFDTFLQATAASAAARLSLGLSLDRNNRGKQPKPLTSLSVGNNNSLGVTPRDDPDPVAHLPKDISHPSYQGSSAVQPSSMEHTGANTSTVTNSTSSSSPAIDWRSLTEEELLEYPQSSIGVHRLPSGRFRVQFIVNGKLTYFGTYSTFLQACVACADARIRVGLSLERSNHVKPSRSLASKGTSSGQNSVDIVHQDTTPVALHENNMSHRSDQDHTSTVQQPSPMTNSEASHHHSSDQDRDASSGQQPSPMTNSEASLQVVGEGNLRDNDNSSTGVCKLPSAEGLQHCPIGVFRKPSGRYVVQFAVDSKRTQIGTYDTYEQATAACAAARVSLGLPLELQYRKPDKPAPRSATNACENSADKATSHDPLQISISQGAATTVQEASNTDKATGHDPLQVSISQGATTAAQESSNTLTTTGDNGSSVHSPPSTTTTGTPSTTVETGSDIIDRPAPVDEPLFPSVNTQHQRLTFWLVETAGVLLQERGGDCDMETGDPYPCQTSSSEAAISSKEASEVVSQAPAADHTEVVSQAPVDHTDPSQTLSGRAARTGMHASDTAIAVIDGDTDIDTDPGADSVTAAYDDGGTECGSSDADDDDDDHDDTLQQPQPAKSDDRLTPPLSNAPLSNPVVQDRDIPSIDWSLLSEEQLQCYPHSSYGVYKKKKSDNRYEVKFSAFGRQVYLGKFDTYQQATAACAAARLQRGLPLERQSEPVRPTPSPVLVNSAVSGGSRGNQMKNRKKPSDRECALALPIHTSMQHNQQLLVVGGGGRSSSEGVAIFGEGNNWTASIVRRGVRVFLGVFSSKPEAEWAFKQAYHEDVRRGLRKEFSSEVVEGEEEEVEEGGGWSCEDGSEDAPSSCHDGNNEEEVEEEPGLSSDGSSDDDGDNAEEEVEKEYEEGQSPAAAHKVTPIRKKPRNALLPSSSSSSSSPAIDWKSLSEAQLQGYPHCPIGVCKRSQNRYEVKFGAFGRRFYFGCFGTYPQATAACADARLRLGLPLEGCRSRGILPSQKRSRSDDHSQRTNRQQPPVIGRAEKGSASANESRAIPRLDDSLSSIDWKSLSDKQLQSYPHSSIGVYKRSSDHLYQVQFSVHGKNTYVGCFKRLQQATAACAAARLDNGLPLDHRATRPTSTQHREARSQSASNVRESNGRHRGKGRSNNVVTPAPAPAPLFGSSVSVVNDEGVAWSERGQEWTASIMRRGVRVFLGVFADKSEAERTFNEAVEEDTRRGLRKEAPKEVITEKEEEEEEEEDDGEDEFDSWSSSGEDSSEEHDDDEEEEEEESSVINTSKERSQVDTRYCSSVDWNSLTEEELQSYPHCSFGVYKNTRCSTYRIQLSVRGKDKNFGSYKTFSQATAACAALRFSHGLPLTGSRKGERIAPTILSSLTKERPSITTDSPARKRPRYNERSPSQAGRRVRMSKGSVNDHSIKEGGGSAGSRRPLSTSIDWASLSETELRRYPHCDIGVHSLPNGRYKVDFGVNGKTKYIGTYDTYLQATAACAAARLRHGLPLDRMIKRGRPRSSSLPQLSEARRNDSGIAATSTLPRPSFPSFSKRVAATDDRVHKRGGRYDQHQQRYRRDSYAHESGEEDAAGCDDGDDYYVTSSGSREQLLLQRIRTQASTTADTPTLSPSLTSSSFSSSLPPIPLTPAKRTLSHRHQQDRARMHTSAVGTPQQGARYTASTPPPNIPVGVPNHHTDIDEASTDDRHTDPPPVAVTVGQILSDLPMYTHTDPGDPSVTKITITMDAFNKLKADLGPAKFTSFFAAQPVRHIAMHPRNMFSQRQSSDGVVVSTMSGGELGITFLFSNFVDALAIALCE